MIGRTISHYRILDKLGEGGMGVVYEAEDTRLGRRVALKFLPPETTRDPRSRERFLREAQAAAGLSHPNVCTVHEIQEDDGLTFIAMELVDGEDLRSTIESGAHDLERALDIVIQVAEGLREAHNKNTVHRDIKPANIMVTPRGGVKIMDFGLARLAETSQLTRAGTTVGTVAYMSPEQARGDAVDHRTDIWSLGVVLYEAVTGRRPFRGDRDQAVIYSILHEQPEPMSAALPDLPESLEGVVGRMLSKAPDERYQTADDLLAELKAILRSPSWAHETRQFPSTLRPEVARALAALPSDAPSIAVLPFTDMSPAKDQEYFADGLSEELLTALSGLRGLRVAARTSAFSFKGGQDDVREMGRKLSVTTVLEGSVRKAGERVRVSAQLTNVADGYHLWSRTYERKLEDIFSIQEDIARSVAETLRGALPGRREDTLRSPSCSAAAFSLALRARHHHLTYSKESLERATTCLQEAVALDPDYAAAWAGLALSYATRALLLHITFDEGYSLAREAVGNALAADPGLARAHCMLSHIRWRYDWDFAGAEASVERALALEPGSLVVLDAASTQTRLLGRLDEAIALGRRAVELDPLNSKVYNNFGITLYCAGRLDESQAVYERALELNPRNPNPHIGLGNVYMEQGKWEEALEKYESRDPGPVLILFCRAVAYAALGRQVEADAALQELIDKYPEDGAFQIAEILATRGEVDEAFAWLERCYECRDLGLADVKTSPRLKPLHEDPRWEAFLTKMGLPL